MVYVHLTLQFIEYVGVLVCMNRLEYQSKFWFPVAFASVFEESFIVYYSRVVEGPMWSFDDDDDNFQEGALYIFPTVFSSSVIPIDMWGDI